MSANTPTALIEAEVHLGELATGPKAGRPDYVGVLSLADAVALRDELARLRTRVAILSSGAAPTPEASAPRTISDEEIRARFAHRELSDAEVAAVQDVLAIVAAAAPAREASTAPEPSMALAWKRMAKIQRASIAMLSDEIQSERERRTVAQEACIALSATVAALTADRVQMLATLHQQEG